MAVESLYRHGTGTLNELQHDVGKYIGCRVSEHSCKVCRSFWFWGVRGWGVGSGRRVEGLWYSVEMVRGGPGNLRVLGFKVSDAPYRLHPKPTL